MIRPVVGKEFFLRIAPTSRAALICILEADQMIYVDEVTGFAGVKAYSGIGLVTPVFEVFTVISACNDN
tara:strand:- start:335 stop:541 length:207 start_codon:yes stop_codon:yes gene_type:complete